MALPDLHVTSTVLVVLAAPFVGSFLAVVAIRVAEGRGFVGGRSRCPVCHAVLGPTSLIPVASWAWQRGRCRSCRARISPYYPLVELSALALAVWAALAAPVDLVVVSCFLGWSLLAVALIDLRSFRLPDALTLPIAAAGLAVTYVIDPGALAAHVAGCVGGFAAFAGIGWAYERIRNRPGLGLGDAKLLAGAGAWLGWLALPSVVLLAALSGLVVSVATGRLRVGLASGRPIAFGPHLSLAFWFVWLHGPIPDLWTVVL